MLDLARVDTLPEYTRYTDTGCELQPACLACPFDRCRYDEPQGARTILRASMSGTYWQYRNAGLSTLAASEAAGISLRTGRRFNAEQKRGTA